MNEHEQQTAEHRREQRNAVEERIAIINLLSGNSIGNLVNISEGGFTLITDQELPINTLFQLRMTLPAGLTESTHIEIGAESLWRNASTTSNYQWYGFHIIDISADNAEMIKRLIQAWHR